MNTVTEKKIIQNADKKIAQTEASPVASMQAQKNTVEELREAIKALDTQRNELVKNTIENIKPGKPLDLAAVREINKIETKKNRLIVARFASLLKKNPSEVQAIVHQIIEI